MPAGGATPVAAGPGAQPYDEALGRRLTEALAARGDRYEPRTHHLEPDGSPRFTNRLILETSPYLLQHAHNPVDWFSWGDEAFERARQLDRPILLSIGYSTCHWCHVMERESFEDEEIARFMNERFVAIKVDREERPDVDNVYMTAVQTLSGSGGWPMTVVLTPDRQPFFAGTYFPPRSGARGASKGFWEILHELDSIYATQKDRVVAQAGQISRRVAQMLLGAGPADIPGAAAIINAAEALARSFDPANGGFGGDRKFPRPVTLELLLRYHRRTGDPQALAMVETTLERMARGGIHDQIGGGFHRYTVEPTWLVPHFEKMLYDNAQLAVVYLEASQAAGRADFAEVARRTLDYVRREMTTPQGGFYSATDADSPAPSGHDEEGWFFTWTPEEIDSVLGEPIAGHVMAYFGVSAPGNFEGRNIFHLPGSLDAVAARLKLKPAVLAKNIDTARQQLYDARLKRPPPLTDTKVITAWNGLMISAFARGAQVLRDDGYRVVAERAANFLLQNCRQEGRLFRTYAEGRAGNNGVLPDYAFLAAALLDLYETTHEPRWLTGAIELHRTLEQHFWDAERGGYFLIADDAERLLGREKPDYDGAEPSGNSVALLNLLRLHEFTGKEEYASMAGRGLAAFARPMTGNPTAVPLLLCALDFFLDRPKEIVLVSDNGPAGVDPFLERLAVRFLPNRVLVVSAARRDRKQLKSLIPLLEERSTRDGKPTAYVCEGRVCKFPTTDPDVFMSQITEVFPYAGDPPALLKPAEKPEPWSYDSGRNQHWHPGHEHWHDGPAPPPEQRSQE